MDSIRRSAIPLAEKCGIAFQFTNILRDVKEDAERGRVYLPEEDLVSFRINPAELLERSGSDRFVQLMNFEADRARKYYQESMPLIDLVDRKSRASLWALIEIYRRLLARIEGSNYEVLSRRIRVPTAEKAWIVLKAFLISPSVQKNP